MLTLHYAPGTASLVVHWLLIELDLEHELRLVDLASGGQKSTDYLALNPAGVVPTLVIDGEPLCEAVAIVMHIADVHSLGSLAPPIASKERAAYYQWLLVCANSLQPAFRAWFYPDEPAGEANAEASKAHASARIEAVWERIDAHLAAGGPFLLGASLSAADFMLTMMMRWSRNLPRPALDWPALARHAGLMRARPSFAELYARERLTDWR